MPVTSAPNTTITDSVSATAAELILFLKDTPEAAINTVPFEESWTIAQVADHITLSNISITRALSLQGAAINRVPDERTVELQDIFLDFSKKFKAPGFILPSKEVYIKEELIHQLEQSFTALREAGNETDLSVLINHPAFGDISKLEILYFVWFHTQRHLQQVKNISRHLQGKRL